MGTGEDVLLEGGPGQDLDVDVFVLGVQPLASTDQTKLKAMVEANVTAGPSKQTPSQHGQYVKLKALVVEDIVIKTDHAKLKIVLESILL